MSPLPISSKQDQSPTPPQPQTELDLLLEAEQMENTEFLSSMTQENDTSSMPAQLQDPARTPPPQNIFLQQPQTMRPLSLPVTYKTDSSDSYLQDGLSPADQDKLAHIPIQ